MYQYINVVAFSVKTHVGRALYYRVRPVLVLMRRSKKDEVPRCQNLPCNRGRLVPGVTYPQTTTEQRTS